MLDDDFELTREDADIGDESRFVTLGLSDVGNLLVVVYAYREPDTLRVISAWKANKRQRVLLDNTVLEYFRGLVDKAAGGKAGNKLIVGGEEFHGHQDSHPESPGSASAQNPK